MTPSESGLELMLDPEEVAKVAPAILEGRPSMELIARDVDLTLPAFNEAVSAARGEYTVLVHKVQTGPIPSKTPGVHWSKQITVGYEINLAVMYIGRIAGLELYPIVGAYKYDVGVTFEGGAIIHKDGLFFGPATARFAATDFLTNGPGCVGQKLVMDPEKKFGVMSAGVYIAPGYDATEKFLRRIGFQGDWTQDINQLYASMQKQNEAMEAAAVEFFFR